MRGLPTEQQVAQLKEQYRILRGSHAVVRARVEEQPVRPYISLLEQGCRVTLEQGNDVTFLVLRPDGSNARLGPRGAHSVVAHPDGRIYTNTTDNRVAVLDGSTRRVLAHIPVGDEPSHLDLSHDGRHLYVANSGSNDMTIIDTSQDEPVAKATAAMVKKVINGSIRGDISGFTDSITYWGNPS